MGKKLKLANILWYAANVKLRSDDIADHNAWVQGQRAFSCEAVARAEQGLGGSSTVYYAENSCSQFLAELGVDCESIEQFDEFEPGEVRQGARYLWLDFARLVAVSEGL